MNKFNRNLYVLIGIMESEELYLMMKPSHEYSSHYYHHMQFLIILQLVFWFVLFRLRWDKWYAFLSPSLCGIKLKKTPLYEVGGTDQRPIERAATHEVIKINLSHGSPPTPSLGPRTRDSAASREVALTVGYSLSSILSRVFSREIVSRSRLHLFRYTD